MKIKALTLTSAVLMGIVSAPSFSADADKNIRFDGFPDFDSSLKVILPDFEKRQGFTLII